jgi:hypothetical protein
MSSTNNISILHKLDEVAQSRALDLLFESSSLLTALNLVLSWVRRSSTLWASSAELSVLELITDFERGC